MLDAGIDYTNLNTDRICQQIDMQIEYVIHFKYTSLLQYVKLFRHVSTSNFTIYSESDSVVVVHELGSLRVFVRSAAHIDLVIHWGLLLSGR